MNIATRHARFVALSLTLGLAPGAFQPVRADVYPFSRGNAARSWMDDVSLLQDPWLLGAPGTSVTSASYTSSSFPSARFNTSALSVGHGQLVGSDLALHLRGGLQYELGLSGALARIDGLALSWDATAIADNYLLARPGSGAFSVINLPPYVGWGGDLRLSGATMLDGWLTVLTPLLGWRSNRTIVGLEAHVRKTWAPLTWMLDAAFVHHPSIVDLKDPTWAIAGQEITLGTALQVALLPRVGLNLSYQNQPQNAYGLANQSLTAGLSYLAGDLREKRSGTLFEDLYASLARLWEVPEDREATSESVNPGGAEPRGVASSPPSDGPGLTPSTASVQGENPTPVPASSPVPESGNEALPVPPVEESSTPDAPITGKAELSLATPVTATVSLLKADSEGRFTAIQQARLEGRDRLSFQNLAPGRYRLKIEESTGDPAAFPTLLLATWDQVGDEVHRDAADLRWDGAGFSEHAFPGGARFYWPALFMRGTWTYQVMTYRSDALKRSVALGRYPQAGTPDLEIETRLPEAPEGAVWGVVRFWSAGDRYGGTGIHGQSRPFRVWIMPDVTE